jgi:hypothetical protein
MYTQTFHGPYKESVYSIIPNKKIDLTISIRIIQLKWMI